MTLQVLVPVRILGIKVQLLPLKWACYGNFDTVGTAVCLLVAEYGSPA